MDYTGQSTNLGKLATIMVMLGAALGFAAACDRESGEPDTGAPVTYAVPGGTVSMALEAQGQDVAIRQPPATYTAVPTVTSPPTMTPAPLPPTQIARASQFGESRNFLTGELVGDPQLLQRRPIAVKISNAPARWTRPQAGLSQADLVFEHLTEGSITRFTAILYGSTPSKVGPIRSARLIDLELPAMYDAALAFSGSSIGVSRKLFNSDFQERILRTNTPGYYRTGENKPYEHTLYATPELLWDTLTERGENHQPEFGAVMAFSGLMPTGGSPAPSLTVRYHNFTTIEWRYDAGLGRYLRWADGDRHLDANTGEQIGASNVVVLKVPHQLDETICEYQSEGRCLAHSMEIQLWGEGQAVVLRDGQAFDVTWRRDQPHEPLTFIDESQRPFPLQIGKTWFQVVPNDYADAFAIGSTP